MKRWEKVGKLTQIKYGAMYLLIVLQIMGRPSQVRELPNQIHTACHAHSREGRERLMKCSRTYFENFLSQIVHLQGGNYPTGRESSRG